MTFQSIGCYGDLGNSRTLQNGSQIASSMTVEMCVDFASQGGWQYAGVENGEYVAPFPCPLVFFVSFIPLFLFI
jgi:hypothetical protein